MKHYRVWVTGDREDWEKQEIPAHIECKSLPVLEYERLPVKPELLERLSVKPADWIIFTSPRSVTFWVQTLLAAGWELPVETRVACMGSKTAEAANEVGFTVDFEPREPGTDGFLDEFEQQHRGGSVIIPAAEGGRPKLRDRLKKLGFEVTWIPLYRTLPRQDLAETLMAEPLGDADAIVFTSPSSVDAVLDLVDLPENLQVLAIGSFTGHHLEQRGFVRPRLLPQGDFTKLGEVLC